MALAPNLLTLGLLLTLAVLCQVTAGAGPSQSNSRRVSKAQLLWALWKKESGLACNAPKGDGGKAIGPLQIWRSYFSDCSGNAGLSSYESVLKLPNAVKCIEGYMKRYAPGRLKDFMSMSDAETISRIHNGGPSGHKMSATNGYWSGVRKFLSQAPSNAANILNSRCGKSNIVKSTIPTATTKPPAPSPKPSPKPKPVPSKPKQEPPMPVDDPIQGDPQPDEEIEEPEPEPEVVETEPQTSAPPPRPPRVIPKPRKPTVEPVPKDEDLPERLETEESSTSDEFGADSFSENPDVPTKRPNVIQNVRDWIGDRVNGVKTAISNRGGRKPRPADPDLQGEQAAF